MASKKFANPDLEFTTVKVGEVDHIFHEPTGNDLVSYEQALKVGEISELEAMAILAALLSEDKTYDVAYFLNLSFKKFRLVTTALNDFFV